MVNSERRAHGGYVTTGASPRRTARGIGGRLLIAAGLCLLAAAGSSCARARAETAPEGPPLATPAPPPRVLAPVEQVLAEAPAPPETPAESSPAPPEERRPAPRRTPATETQKPPDPQPPPAPAPAVVADAPAVRQPTANPTEERKIRDILERFAKDLSRVDWQNLNADGKAQYDQAKRFSELAETAIKDRNYPLAATQADKAATIASQLLR
jgi:hypothetical protein